MKFVISKKCLSKMLDMVSEAIEAIEAIDDLSKSELKEIVIVAGDKNIYIMGRYLDFSITVQAFSAVLEVGTILVDAKNIIEVIKDINDDEVIIVKEMEDNLVNIKSRHTDTNISTKNITTYSENGIYSESC